MPWQFSFKKIMLFCSNYAENYASTIGQGLCMSSSSTIVWVNVDLNKTVVDGIKLWLSI